jgi:hypothetical protein
MSRRQPRDRIGATPAKLSLIGVLALVLAAVVASNWPTSAAPATATPPQVSPATSAGYSPAPPATTGAAGSIPASPFGKFAADDPWPERPLSQVTSFDPFAPAAWATPPAAEDIAETYSVEQISELLSTGNAIILSAGDTQVARIGTHEFRVGDMIGGFKISDISPRGVVLTAAD